MLRTPLLVALLCFISAGLHAEEDPAIRYKLDNGLRVILRPLKGAKSVAAMTLYDIGGDSDPNERSGMAHYIEHLLVTSATPDAPQRTVGEYMRKYTLGWNAQTGDNSTILATVFPRDRIAGELHDAAARMSDLRIERSDLEREMPRLIDEVRNMFGGIPALAATNLVREKLRPTPYNGRKGGLKDAFEVMTVEELSRRWQKYYRPNNAQVVVVGDFDPEAVQALITKEFGSIRSGETAPPREKISGPTYDRGDPVVVSPQISRKQGYVCVGFKAPPPSDISYPAFLVQAARLTNNAQSQNFRGDASEYPVVYAPLDDPEVIFVRAPVKQAESPVKKLEELRKFIKSTVEMQFTPTDMVVTKQMYANTLGLEPQTDFVMAQNPYGVALLLGRGAQLGLDLPSIRKGLANMSDDQLKAIAASVFNEDKAAEVIVVPDNAFLAPRK